MSTNGLIIRIKGKVQGVGFRPYIWQLAKKFTIYGDVTNDAMGILIHVWRSPDIAAFITALTDAPPPLATIERIEQAPYHWQIMPTIFTINASIQGLMDTHIAPDAATCDDCLKELNTPNDRRYHYPFINCTHCGPRFTIIKQMPYDRPNTVMQTFTLCPACQQEYESPLDRRFHAQPIACPVCGPQVWICRADGKIVAKGDLAISFATEQLAQGKIIAIKGVGGFHLACDATQDAVVKCLRERKKRPNKPFAVMLPDSDWLTQCVSPEVDNTALSALLTSAAAPIVLVNRHFNSPICYCVAPNLQEIGLMLPSNPLHHLLLQQWQKPLVMTSGNPPHQPTLINNTDALTALNTIADYFLLHDRGIVQRADDSIVRFRYNQLETLRRARGYVPDALQLPDGFDTSPCILAVGADLKNTFCLLQAPYARVSQYFGDLNIPSTAKQWQTTLDSWLAIYHAKPNLIALDAHPSYAASQLAEQFSQQLDIPMVNVYHHHAHIAACLAEYAYPFATSPVIGLAFDGLGYGQHGELWGGECLLVDYKRCIKLGGLPAVALPGADLAAKEPWRNLLAHFIAFIPNWQARPELQNIPTASLMILARAIMQGINSPLASSAGRLFDAIAAALGITKQSISWEGEAACQLESMACQYKGDETPITMSLMPDMTIDLASFWHDWLTWSAEPCAKAYAFHLALARGMAQLAIASANKYQTKTIVLSGGVMHNSLLRQLLCQQLPNYNVIYPRHLPANDGGISLGQAIIAAAQYKCIN